VRTTRADCDRSQAHVDRDTFFPSKDKTFIGRPALLVMEYPRDDGTMGSPAVHSASRLSSRRWFMRLSDHVKHKCYRIPLVCRTVT
jgi:hypothetical protein